MRVQRDKNNNITPLKPQISITYSNSKQDCEEIFVLTSTTFLGTMIRLQKLYGLVLTTILNCMTTRYYCYQV